MWRCRRPSTALCRHCEERSDEAIQNGLPGLVSGPGLLRFARNDGVLAARFFVRVRDLPKPFHEPPSKAGRRSAERRVHPMAAPQVQALPPEHARGAAAGISAPARLPALHRGTRQVLTPGSASGPRFMRARMGMTIPLPGQRVPRGPVVVPAGRGPKAARERCARPRAGFRAHSALKIASGKRPFGERSGALLPRARQLSSIVSILDTCP